jgi:hypothetical protein
MLTHGFGLEQQIDCQLLKKVSDVIETVGSRGKVFICIHRVKDKSSPITGLDTP